MLCLDQNLSYIFMICPPCNLSYLREDNHYFIHDSNHIFLKLRFCYSVLSGLMLWIWRLSIGGDLNIEMELSCTWSRCPFCTCSCLCALISNGVEWIPLLQYITKYFAFATWQSWYALVVLNALYKPNMYRCVVLERLEKTRTRILRFPCT